MPAAVPWITIADVHARFGVRDGDDRDGIAIRKACAQACSWVEMELGRRVLAATYIRRFGGSGKPYLPLPALPIRRIVSLTINESPVTIGTADDAAVNPSIAYHDRQSIWYGGSAGLPREGWASASGVGFSVGMANVRVEWEAGYLVDEIPAVIRGMTETLAGVFWREKHRVGDRGRSAGRGASSEYLRELVGADLQAARGMTDWRLAYIDQGIPLEGDAGSELGVFTLGDAELG